MLQQPREAPTPSHVTPPDAREARKCDVPPWRVSPSLLYRLGPRKPREWAQTFPAARCNSHGWGPPLRVPAGKWGTSPLLSRVPQLIRSPSVPAHEEESRSRPLLQDVPPPSSPVSPLPAAAQSISIWSVCHPSRSQGDLEAADSAAGSVGASVGPQRKLADHTGGQSPQPIWRKRKVRLAGYKIRRGSVSASARPSVLRLSGGIQHSLPTASLATL